MVRILSLNLILIIIFLPSLVLSKHIISSKKFDGLIVYSALTLAERTKGLMFKKKLEDSNGMIFLYSVPQVVNIWMKNTYLALDIIFVNENNEVTSIKNGKPLSKILISSENPVIAVIEIPKNCSKEINLNVGDKIFWRIMKPEENKPLVYCLN